MIIEIPLQIAGRFKVLLIDKSTGLVREEREFPNIITNGGLDLIGSGVTLPNIFNYLDIGIGTTTPKTTDGALANSIHDSYVNLTRNKGSVPGAAAYGLHVRSNSNDGVSPVTTTSTTPECSIRTITRTTNGDFEANVPMTELGFWNTPGQDAVIINPPADNGKLANRSLIKDAAGTPTVIQKTASDHLQLQFSYQIFAPQTDITGSFPGDGFEMPSLNYTIRPQGVNLVNNWQRLLDDIGDWRPTAFLFAGSVLTGRTSVNNPGSGIQPTTATVQPYVAGTFYRDVIFEWGPNAGNVTNQGLYTFSPWGNQTDASRMCFQMAITPLITKVQDRKLRWTLRFSFGRK